MTKKTILFSVTVLALSALQVNADQHLSCKKLGDIMAHNSAIALRPFCDQAELRCKALELVEKRPKDDTLRGEVEQPLRTEVQYLLSICEVAYRAHHPRGLDPR
jgi:hypothetical protein